MGAGDRSSTTRGRVSRQGATTRPRAIPRGATTHPGATTHRGGGPVGRWSFFSHTGNLPALAWLIPWGIAAVYLIVFLVQLSHNLWLLGWNSDFASGFTVPTTAVATGTGGHTVLGTYSLYVPLWFGLLTASLPLHRELWEIAPTGLFIATALTIGWSVAQIATRRAAVLAVVIVLVASPAALGLFMAAVAHNTVYPCTALLGAYFIWLAHGDGRRRATTLAVPPLAAIALGTCLASDVLLVSTGIFPFALTAVLACFKRDRRSKLVALSALTTVVVALPVAVLTSATMSSLGYKTHPPPLIVAPLSSLSANGKLLIEGLERYFNGYLGSPGTTGTLSSALGVACSIVMAVALLTLLVAGTRSAASLILSRWRVDNSKTPTQLATSLHTTYWVSSAISACGAFVFSTFGPVHEAFFASVIFSVAAVIPLFLSSRLRVRRLILGGTSIFLAGSLVGLASTSIANTAVLAPYEGTIVKLAQASHATAGYAGYWDSSGLTWSSHERITVRPVYTCPNPGGANLCIFPQETVPSWYAATRQRRTFVLARPEELSPPSGLGRPLATYSVGPAKMFIYPYDIASRLGPPSG
jgi:hypothetical protein